MKLGSILLLACIQVFAQNNYQTFESDNFIGLKDVNGNTIIQPVYDNLGWSNNGIQPYNETIGAKNGKKWGLLSIAGKELTPAIYDKIEPFFGGYYKVAIKGKFTNRYFYGLIDNRGKIKLNLDYFALEYQDGVAIATKLVESKFLKGVLNEEFLWLAPISYEKIRIAEKLIIAESPNGQFDIFDLAGEKLASELDALDAKRSHLITNQLGKVGKISWDGLETIPAVNKEISPEGTITSFPNWLIDPDGENFRAQADSISRWNLEWLIHRNGFFQIYSDGKSISKEYEFVERGKHSIIARSNGKANWLALDVSVQAILLKNDSIKVVGNFLVTKEKNLWSVYDRAGQRITDKSFEAVVHKNSRYLAVKKHNYWAILDGVKKELSPFRYDEIGEIVGSKAIVKYIHQWGVFHPEHGWLLQPTYKKIEVWNGYFIGKKKDSYHLFDGTGFPLFQTIDQLIPRQEMIVIFHEGNVSAIGKRGKPLTNTEYKSVTKWDDYFEFESEFSELMNEDGSSILRARDMVQDVVGFSEGYFLIVKNDHFGFVDTDGKLRIANRYDSAKVFSEGYAPIKLRGKWGFIDKEEKLVIQPHYQEVSAFQNGIAIYQLNGLYGFLDKEGKEISKANFPEIQRTAFGNYILIDKSGRFGFANEKGILSLSPSFESIEDLGANRIRTTRNGKIGLLDYSGREILGFDYDAILIIGGCLLLRQD